MPHLPHLITDLALILCSAGVVTLIFKRLNQPVVLGYIIAGLLVGPNFSLFPTITEIDTIKIWAEIGVVFLLFSLGLEFSFKKLVRVGNTAAVTGLFEVTAMLVTGFFTGQLLGWNKIDSLFLGGIIAISSTTIIFRAFDELNLKSKKFAGIVIGVLVIEDLVAVLLMVLLSTVAVSMNFAGADMFMSMIKLVFFLTLWFLAGIYILPALLMKTGKWLTDETLLIIAIALCLMMVWIAASVGFSAALGAFIMGSILAETTKAERIEHVIKPIKDLFGAVFFVSVGMLINPQLLIEHALPVLVLTLVVVFGKFIYASVGALMSGQPLKQSVETGTSLTQIGEFSFIIASLGLSLNVTSSFLYPIAVGVSVITTFTTPYMMKLAAPIHQYLEKILPEKWQQAIIQYSAGAQHINAESDWKRLLKSFLKVVFINAVVSVAIIIVFVKYVEPLMIVHGLWGSIITAALALTALSPFLYMLTAKRINKPSYTQLWINKYNRGPIIGMEILRVGVGVVLVGVLFERLFSTSTAFFIGLGVIVLSVYIFRRKLRAFSMLIEKRFINNLNMRENTTVISPVKQLLPWDAHLSYFDIQPEHAFIGEPLEQLKWREQYGINIAMIERGNKNIMVPNKAERLFPYDRIAVIGTDAQISSFTKAFEQWIIPVEQLVSEVKLISLGVHPGFPFFGLSIRESNIRNEVSGLIVGIERNGTRVLNPDSSWVFELNDLVWIVGDAHKIRSLV